MPQRFRAWKAGRRLGARIAFVAAIFLLMSIGAVVADSHGTFGGVFHVPIIQASHSDAHSSSHEGRSSNQDESQGNSQDEGGNSQGNNGADDKKGNKDDCGNGDKDAQTGYQDQCDEGHSHGHGHHRHDGGDQD